MTYESILRTLLRITKPIANSLPLYVKRTMQNALANPMLKNFGANPNYIESVCDNGSFYAYPNGDYEREVAYLYMHGGAYTAGGCKYVHAVAGVLACKLNACVMGCVYRLAPEFPFPCCLEDAYECYLKLSEKYENIALIGESAGGGMAFSLCDMIKEAGLNMPKAVIAFSPWTDLMLSGSSVKANKNKDVSLSEKQLRKSAHAYAADHDITEPRISPVNLNTEGFPRTLLYVGSDELLLCDTVKIHENLIKHGIPSEMNIGEGLWHAYPLFNIDCSDEIFNRIRDFVKDDD